MAEITPTPRAGHWITVDGVTVSEAAPRAGHWITVDGVTVSEAAPRAGHWIRVDSLPTFRRPTDGWSVGFLKF